MSVYLCQHMYTKIDKNGVICYYEIVMKNIQNKIHMQIYGYRRGEFMPVYSAGELQNRGEFVKYKLRSLVTRHSLI